MSSKNAITRMKIIGENNSDDARAAGAAVINL
jgi:hypothetical protein